MAMAGKVLRSSTIIPDGLYVDRDADRQLDAIVEEMGRPGYVLVARQMGKTNLLLRMKRRREAGNEIVLYYDLSTPFESARDLFRYVVDGLTDRLANSSLSELIRQERQDRHVDPNAEYDRHIRLALSNTEADRIIIVLDEIDSLVGRDYSDRVLAQIRSMYFARANHEVYQRLTYVLSGVAEPTDLIKNKNISPFNIGEKIYLADFSLEEVSQLIRKAGLNFSSDSINSVFSWISGNPRMTWDVCSALEDLERSGEVVSPTTVDSIVERLYLTRQDRPPIDHMRVLAETDLNVRSALISLLHGRGDKLDDNAKSRLYLAGITNASAEGSPKLKNRVVEMALSESWLTQVETQLNGITKTASSFYRDGNYEQAVTLFEEFILQTGGNESLDDIQLFELAMSQYKLSRFNDAKGSLLSVLEKTKSRDFRNPVRFHLASTYLLSDEAVKAIPLLEELAKSTGSYKLQAKHALTTAHLAISASENADKVIQISREVLADAEADHDLSKNELAELRAASHYNMAQAFIAKKDDDNAQVALHAAIGSIDREHLPGLAARIISLIRAADSRILLINSAVDKLLEEKPAFSTAPAAFEFRTESLVRLMDAAIRDKQNSAFDSLLNFGLCVTEGSRFTKLHSLAQLGSFHDKAVVNRLLRLAFEPKQIEKDEVASERLDAARLWLSVSDEPDNTNAFQFLSNAINNDPVFLQETDLILVVNRLAKLMRVAAEKQALQVVEFVRRHAEFFSMRTHSIFALYVQHEMALFRGLGDVEREHVSAKELMRLTAPSTVKNLNLTERSESLISRIRILAKAALVTETTQPFAGIGRNDVVVVKDLTTGLQRSTKFKLISDRLHSGEFELVKTIEKARRG